MRRTREDWKRLVAEFRASGMGTTEFARKRRLNRRTLQWWAWELRFLSHVERRMEERGFSEADVRSMLEEATALRQSRRAGRWLVRTRLAGRSWIVVVEPDLDEEIVLVVTAYPRR